MTGFLLDFLTILAQAEIPHDPVASITPWLSILTGSGGGLVVLGLWVRALLAEKKEMVEAHKEKDRQLVEITRESIACIEASISRADIDDKFKNRLEDLLKRIDAKLDSV